MARNKTFKAYVFDLDDNLRVLNTKMIMTKPNGETEEVSTEEFKKIKLDLKGHGYLEKVDFSKACVNFRKEKDCLFIEQILTSKSAASWPDYVECINNAYIHAINTSRGHSISAFEKVTKNMIISNFDGLDYASLVANQREYMGLQNIDHCGMSDEEILDYYISKCRFYPMEDKGTSLSVLGDEECHDPCLFKPRALDNFCEYIEREYNNFLSCIPEHDRYDYLKNGMHVGFSDDDERTMVAIIDNLLNNKKEESKLQVHIYSTSSGIKKKVF